jgi:hypothetical protein
MDNISISSVTVSDNIWGGARLVLNELIVYGNTLITGVVRIVFELIVSGTACFTGETCFKNTVRVINAPFLIERVPLSENDPILYPGYPQDSSFTTGVDTISTFNGELRSHNISTFTDKVLISGPVLESTGGLISFEIPRVIDEFEGEIPKFRSRNRFELIGDPQEVDSFSIIGSWKWFDQPDNPAVEKFRSNLEFHSFYLSIESLETTALFSPFLQSSGGTVSLLIPRVIDQFDNEIPKFRSRNYAEILGGVEEEDSFLILGSWIWDNQPNNPATESFKSNLLFKAFTIIAESKDLLTLKGKSVLMTNKNTDDESKASISLPDSGNMQLSGGFQLTIPRVIVRNVNYPYRFSSKKTFNLSSGSGGFFIKGEWVWPDQEDLPIEEEFTSKLSMGAYQMVMGGGGTNTLTITSAEGTTLKSKDLTITTTTEGSFVYKAEGVIPGGLYMRVGFPNEDEEMNRPANEGIYLQAGSGDPDAFEEGYVPTPGCITLNAAIGIYLVAYLEITLSADEINLLGLVTPESMAVAGAFSADVGPISLGGSHKGPARTTFLGENAAGALPLSGGEANTLMGFEAGKEITTGAHNSCFGAETGSALTSGNLNTFIGWNSGGVVISGTNNFCLGNYAGTGSQIGIPFTSSSSNVGIFGNDSMQNYYFSGPSSKVNGFSGRFTRECTSRSTPGVYLLNKIGAVFRIKPIFVSIIDCSNWSNQTETGVLNPLANVVSSPAIGQAMVGSWEPLDLANIDDEYMVMPGYGIIVYDNTNYTGNVTLAVKNISSSYITVSPTTKNSNQSIKLFLNDTQLNYNDY